MRHFWNLLEFIGSLVIEFLRALGAAIAELLRSGARRSGRAAGRGLVWLAGLLVALGLMYGNPQAFVMLVMLGACAFAIRHMLRAPFRKPSSKKKK